MLFSEEELLKVEDIGSKTADRIMEFIKREDPKNILRLKDIEEVSDYRIDNIIDRFSIMMMELNLEKNRVIQDDVEEVHLVGEMNVWQPANKEYALIKEGNSWLGAFRLEEGTEYKVMYDSSSWQEGNYFGDRKGENLVTEL